MARGERFVERLARRTVQVAEDLSVLEKHPGVDHAQELFARGEMIFAPVFLRSTRRARGPGNREVNTADLLAQLAH